MRKSVNHFRNLSENNLLPNPFVLGKTKQMLFLARYQQTTFL